MSAAFHLRTRVVGATFLLGALAGGCTGDASAPLPPDAETTAPRPHVLLVTIDTLRADHCSSYGYDRETTPVLDRLAGEGARFETAYAPMGVTGPSHATLFTSLEPPVHGVRRNGIPLSDEPPLLAERLRASGWRTAAFVSSFVVSGRFGLARGFDHFDDEMSAAGQTMGPDRWEGVTVEGGFDRRATATTDRVLAWLREQDGDTPVFLWVHYFDPHRPYDPPGSWAERFPAPAGAEPLARAVARYDAEIAYTDAEMGRVVEAMETLAGEEGLLVVVTADHGEGLMDHGWPSHGPTLYEEELSVPLVARWPGRLPAGAVLRAPVALLDLTPTLLDLLELPRDGLFVQGRSLASRLLGEGDGDPERAVHTERRAYETERMSARVAGGGQERVSIEMRGPMRAVRRGRFKYIEAPDESRTELYDLAADPRETRNLAPERGGPLAELAAAVASWVERQAALAPAVAGELSPEDEEALRVLGYVP